MDQENSWATSGKYKAFANMLVSAKDLNYFLGMKWKENYLLREKNLFPKQNTKKE
jgi:hypothetical protein